MRLISLTDIQQNRAISQSVELSNINQFIEDAQIGDLRPLLGERMYYDLLNNQSNYIDLLDQTNYTHDGVTYTSPGIKQVLSYYAYARYILHGSATDTPFGYVEKGYQDERQTDRIQRREMYKSTQQLAAQYWSQVEIYLNRNLDTYPLWAEGCTQGKRSFRINKITR